MNDDGTIQWTFVSAAHPTSGKASINPDKTILSFTNFKTDAGPLLEVWLASQETSTTSETYISLGALKSIQGDFTYELQSGIDLKKYDHVVIWCLDFSVSFGYAMIK